MISLLIWAALPVLLSPSQQPVFRSEVYVVTVEVSMDTRALFGLIRRPYIELTVEDVTILLDEETYPAVNLTQDPKRPGHYVVDFTPPEEYRDGEQHTIELIIRRGFRRPTRVRLEKTFPTASVGSVPISGLTVAAGPR